ncbi:SUMO1 sentrin specific peptidase 1 [Podila verticillata]|nr:SUMO1 sentrin specific peptidase 1 [Podila verticillata]
MALKRKTDREVKPAVDMAPGEYSKKAKVLVSGLSSLFSKFDPLSLYTSPRQANNDNQTSRPLLGWVGAYPHLASMQGAFSGLDRDNLQDRVVTPAAYGRRGHHRSTPSLSSLSSESSRPYQLKPYTKLPSFIAPTSFGRSQASSDDGSRSSPSDDSGSDSGSPYSHYNNNNNNLWLAPRFGHPSDRYTQDSLLRMRSRIHAGKAQKPASLLQSKYAKDDSLARQHILDRHSQVNSKSTQNRLKAALDATIGALRADIAKPAETQGSTTDNNINNNTDDVTDQWRIRGYDRPFDVDEEPVERPQVFKRPAWVRIKVVDKEPSWLQNLRNLVAKTLPAIVEVKKDLPAYQGIVAEHERIQRELSEELEPKQEQLMPLSKDEEKKVHAALSDGYGQVVEGFNVSIMKKDIHTLRPGEWLNDEVINFYGQLIMARNKESTELPKVHVFSTFFYKTLSESGYDKVRRWTKKVNVFAMDYLLVPIHCSGNHWTSAVIDMKKKQVEYYDSLLGNSPKCFLILRDYLDRESQDKLKKPFDSTGWENVCPKDIPRQQNGYDCGVFTCTFIERKSRGMAKFDFSQQHMPLLRQKIVLNIINKSL